MRRIDISDNTYLELLELLKQAQVTQVKEHGYIICEAPEDMIPWLIGYYVATEESRKTGGTEYSRDKDTLTRIKELEVH